MRRNYPFVKMHGAGNDFVVMDARVPGFSMQTIREKTPLLCNRRKGIGADGVLMLNHSSRAHFAMHYLNRDGSEAGMCGNGARCLSRFAVDLGYPSKLQIDVHGHEYQAEVHHGYVSIRFPVKPEPEKILIDDELWYKIRPGTEHVVRIDSEYSGQETAMLGLKGKQIRNRTDLFPEGTNVNFSEIIHENHLKLYTYERGVEEITQACGTGAIAASIALDFQKANHAPNATHREESDGVTEHHVQVDCPGGPLEVSFEAARKNDKHIYQNIVLHGPAVSVYRGQILL